MENVTRIAFTTQITPTEGEVEVFLNALEKVIEVAAREAAGAMMPWVKENLDDVLDALIDIKVDVQEYFEEMNADE